MFKKKQKEDFDLVAYNKERFAKRKWKVEWAQQSDLAYAWGIEDKYWELQERTEKLSHEEHEAINFKDSGIEFLKSYIQDNWNKNSNLVKDMRGFIKGIAKGRSKWALDGEIFKGLSRIKNDEAFVGLFIKLIECMWV